MQFLFTFGTLPIAVLLLIVRGFRLERNVKGILYAIVNGIVGGLGAIPLFAAYRTGGNTAVITTVTSLYPMLTAVLAVLILHERLTGRQVLGLILAGVAIIVFST